jgi:alkaline phosphatase D
VIVIWDDHEYSDDCWGANATYFDGRKPEFNPERRRNGEQAFFEYLPIDDLGAPDGGVIETDESRLYPNARIYRDFRFGRHLQLVVTDYRSFRPDHLIPEDAFPGTVPVDRAALTLLLAQLGIGYDAVKDKFPAYVNVDQLPSPLPDYRPILIGVTTQAYLAQGLGLAEARARALASIQGNLDVTVVNQLLTSYNASGAGPQVPLIPPEIIATLDRGISFLILGKVALFSSLGARYLVVKETFDLYAAYRYFVTNGGAENAYGGDQETWLKSRLLSADTTWRVLGSSVSFTSLVLDLTGNLPGLPPELQAALAQLPPVLRNRFYFDVDDWDGFPDFKRGLLQFLQSLGNVAIVSGDIHAAFATQHSDAVSEITAAAVSSASLQQGILQLVRQDPVLSQIPGIEQLVAALDLLVTAANPRIRYASTSSNGVAVLRAGADSLRATLWQMDGKEASVSYYRDAAGALSRMTPAAFRIRNGALAPADS